MAINAIPIAVSHAVKATPLNRCMGTRASDQISCIAIPMATENRADHFQNPPAFHWGNADQASASPARENPAVPVSQRAWATVWAGVPGIPPAPVWENSRASAVRPNANKPERAVTPPDTAKIATTGWGRCLRRTNRVPSRSRAAPVRATPESILASPLTP